MKIRYAVLKSNDITNLCGPECNPFGWTPEIIEERKQTTYKRIHHNPSTRIFFERLEKSILTYGFRNPILVTAGFFSKAHKKAEPLLDYDYFLKRIPPEKLDSLEKLVVAEKVGGSRLWIAQKHDIEVPCIINDFVGLFPKTKILKTAEQIAECFTDVPGKIILDQTGAVISQLPHVHMDKDHFNHL